MQTRLYNVASSALVCIQELLGAMVQAGPSAPVASLPVMSEMMRRLDALESMEAGAHNHLETCALFCWPRDPGSSILAHVRVQDMTLLCGTSSAA